MQMIGSGKNPVTNYNLPLAFSGGSIYKRTVANDRLISLPATVYASTMQGLHDIRMQTIDLFDSDAVHPQQKTVFRYTGTGTMPIKRINCLYDSGMGFNTINGFAEQDANLTVLADPYWEEEANQGSTQNVYDSLALSTGSVIYTDDDGQLLDIGAAIRTGSEVINDMIYDDNNRLYICGDFTGVVTSEGICRFERPSTVTSFGTYSLGASEQIISMAIAPNGDLYVCGDFVTLDGVANADYVAYWDGAVWNGLPTAGADDIVRTLEFDKSGNLYLGGDFTTVNGTSANRIAKWNGTTITALGGGVNDNSVNSIKLINDSLYVGGDFTTIDTSTPADNIALWTVSTSSWSVFNEEPNNTVNVMAVGVDSSLFVGGTFTTIGSNTYNLIARFDNANWHTLGDGLAGGGASCDNIAVDNNNAVYAVGDFTTADGVTMPEKIARYVGENWVAVPFLLTIGNTMAVTTNRNDNGFAVATGSGSVSLDGVTSITNRATAPCRPIFKFTTTASAGSTLYRIKNFTTKQEIFFNDLVIATDETITIDLDNQTFTSSFYGDIRSFLGNNSQHTTFKLLSGVNNIGVFIPSNLASGTIQWRVLHSSIDGGA
jgi:hypothetical protein